MQCAHCATPVPDDAKFCYNCGSQVSDAEGQAAATAAMDRSSFEHMEKLLREDTQGEFQIHKMLGRGGMAVVYLATETHLSRKVAIKVLPPELTFGHGIERFMREAKTAAALDHSNIIPIYRISSSGKIFWYAMKYLEGRSLEDIIKEKQRLPLPETIQILWQVADALDYAHEHSVIHRDMKPANVMLDTRNRVVVTDFGIAKALTERTLTASGSVVGTPYYMSPEQGMGKPVTGRSDQYSVAVMAYRMLSGQVPFEGDSAIDILHKHVMVAPPPLQEVCPDLPRHVCRAVHKALEKKPDQRFPTVSAFVEAVRNPSALADVSGEVAEAATIAVSPGLAPAAVRAAQLPTTKRPAQPEVPARAPGPGPARTKKRSWKAAVVTLSFAAVAGGGLGAWLLTQGSRGTTPESTAGAGAARRDSLPALAAALGQTATQLPAPTPTDTGPAARPATESAGGSQPAGPTQATSQPTAGPATQPAAQRTAPQQTAQRGTQQPLGQTTAQQRGTVAGAAERTAQDHARTDTAGARPSTTTAPPTRVTDTRPAAAPNTGRVTIQGLPPSALVAIDGTPREGTEFDLPPGRHFVRMGGRGHRMVTQMVDVAVGQQHVVNYGAQTPAGGAGRADPERGAPGAVPPAAVASELGILQVRITPWARVSLGGADLGQRTTVVDTLIPGTHVLRFERPGFVTIDTTVTVTAGALLRLNIRMTPRNP